MITPETMIMTLIGAVFASTGFWAFVTQVYLRKHDGKTAQGEMLRGIGHNLICKQGADYIARGWISKNEYEDIHDYLFLPYKQLGGNGTAEKIMKEIEKLPLKEID